MDGGGSTHPVSSCCAGKAPSRGGCCPSTTAPTTSRVGSRGNNMVCTSSLPLGNSGRGSLAKADVLAPSSCCAPVLVDPTTDKRLDSTHKCSGPKKAGCHVHDASASGKRPAPPTCCGTQQVPVPSGCASPATASSTGSHQGSTRHAGSASAPACSMHTSPACHQSSQVSMSPTCGAKATRVSSKCTSDKQPGSGCCADIGPALSSCASAQAPPLAKCEIPPFGPPCTTNAPKGPGCCASTADRAVPHASHSGCNKGAHATSHVALTLPSNASGSCKPST